MKSVIIFGSQYGSAKQYAEAMSKKLNIDCFDYRKMKSDKKYDVILYVGSLYAGGVLGLAKTLKRYSANDLKKILIITVGIADPNDIENVENIKDSIYKQLPRHLNNNIELFHVRGSLDYSKLNLKHKTMMKLLYHFSKKLPIEEQSEETKTFIATYNQTVDFVDFNSLECVIERYLQLIKENNL